MLHPEYRWQELKRLLYLKFLGWTISPNFYSGGWVNPETGEKIEDESRKYFVDIKRKYLNKMRSFIKELAAMFKQQCIRFEYEGKIEYIYSEEVKK